TARFEIVAHPIEGGTNTGISLDVADGIEEAKSAIEQCCRRGQFAHIALPEKYGDTFTFGFSPRPLHHRGGVVGCYNLIAFSREPDRMLACTARQLQKPCPGRDSVRLQLFHKECHFVFVRLLAIEYVV